MESKIQKANHFLNTASGYILDIVSQYYIRYIKDEQDSDTIIELIKSLVNWDYQTDESEKIEPLYSTQEYHSMISSNMSYIDKPIDSLIAQRVEEDDFYKRIWDHINDELLFGNDKEKLIGFLTFFSNSKVPYYKLPETQKLSDEEYRIINSKTTENLKKFLFIISINYEQRTESAYQILQLLEEYSDEKQKTVFLANILLFYEMQIKNLNEYINKIEEENNSDE